VFFALMNAMRSFKSEMDIELKSPLTPERVLLSLYKDWNRMTKQQRNGLLESKLN